MPHQYVKTILEKYLGLSRVKIVDLHQELMSMDFLIKIISDKSTAFVPKYIAKQTRHNRVKK